MISIVTALVAWSPLTSSGPHASLRAAAARRYSRSAPAPVLRLQSPPPVSLLLAEDAASSGGTDVSVVDTLLDVAVYALLLGVVGLTLYSLYVTLDDRNKEYGGWVKKEDEDLPAPSSSPSNRLRSGAVYDPATEQWTYPTKAAVAPRVGRAASADDAAGGNRYERRMEKKQKQKSKAQSKRSR